MTYVAYEPEQAGDVFSAFRAMRHHSVGVMISPDPLGPVNRIVSLVRGERRIKSVLVPRLSLVGAEVKIHHESSGYTITELFALSSQQWDSRGYRATNGIPEPPPLPPRRDPGWYVTIDGQVALYASDSEIWPLPPVEPVPWRVRTHRAAKRAITARARRATDAIARRFGYVHEDEAGDW
ncbi:hypothetical protein MHPYR_180085 [uncultured Mycobacterium sp.]|uniref:Uncharacterized protein n=1 Tax=uncultured Mycobacterium sp. TaxID=171292 RepID=A0A1Y5P936_9MYCO|nr:hypothetical protein MHPYR_180085 [uncultured Mycobacterium sp.]